MFFPYTTDALLYHLPIATVSVIVLNILAFAGMVQGSIDPDAGPWVLTWGQGIRPLEWLFSGFTHGDFGHLLNNMLFLWVFGMVVEGKLGWKGFLTSYLGIGATQCAVEQTVMLGYSGEPAGSFGASSMVYGLMVMAALWAPNNNISFAYWIGMAVGTFELSILIVAGLFVGLDILTTIFLGGDAATSVLHLLGGALGFPVGMTLLRRGVVETEGNDLISLNTSEEAKQAKAEQAHQQRAGLRSEAEQTHLQAGLQQFRGYLAAGSAGAALTLYRKMEQVQTGLPLEPQDLVGLVNGLHAEKRWKDSAPFMAELIERAPQIADPARLKLAQICVVEIERPGRAIELLAAIDPARLNEGQRNLAQRLRQRALHMQQEGTVEIDDGSW